MKKATLILYALAIQVTVIYSQEISPTKIDSFANFLLRMSETFLYNAKFSHANEVLQFSFCKTIKSYSPKYELMFLIQELRVEQFKNIVYQESGDLQKNYERLTKLASGVSDLTSKQIQARFYLAFSKVHRALKNMDSADVYETRALNTYQKAGRLDKVAEIRASQISRKHMQFFRESNKEEILKLIPEYELEISNAGKYSKYVLSFNTRHLAQIYLRQTLDYDKALNLFRKSLYLRKEIGFKAFMPASYASLGDVYVKKGEYDPAIEMYLKSKELADEIGFVRYQFYPYLCLGDIYLLMGHEEKAIEYYTMALKSAAENNYVPGIDQAIEKIRMTK